VDHAAGVDLCITRSSCSTTGTLQTVNIGSSVGTVTVSGSNAGRGKTLFSQKVQTGSDTPPQSGLQRVPGSSLPGVKRPGVQVNTDLHLLPRCGIPPFPLRDLYGVQRDRCTFCLLSNLTGLSCSAAKLSVRHFLQNYEAWATKKKLMPDTRYLLTAQTQTK
jgi:hypothetical protein